MKRIYLALLLMLLLGISLFGQEAKPTLAVLDVAGKEVTQSRLDLVYEYIIDIVNQTGDYTLVERKEIDKALQELELSLSDIVDEKTAVQIGKISGAEYMLLSSLNLEEGTYYLSMRVVSVETAKISKTSIKKTELFTNVEGLVREAVEQLLDFDFNSIYGEGYIIRRNFISSGTSLGIPFTIGDVTTVWRMGFSPLLYCGYNLTFDWGILGISIITGTSILSTKSDVTYQARMFACPINAAARYETNLNSPFFGFAEVGGGISLLIVNYKEDYGISQDTVGKPMLSIALGGGFRITGNINISISGNLNTIFMDDVTYIDIAPSLRAGFYF